MEDGVFLRVDCRWLVASMRSRFKRTSQPQLMRFNLFLNFYYAFNSILGNKHAG